MRKDVRTGLFIGIGIMFVGWVLFALFSDSLQERRHKQLINEPAVPNPAWQDLPQPVTNPPQPRQPVIKTEQPALETFKIHVVEAGQTLSSIAALYYGKGDQWPKILQANQDILQSPAQLRPGMRLKIPKQ